MNDSLQKLCAPVTLRPEATLEPLVCRWYAWPHLLAPAQLALNVHARLLPLLRSFVANPAVHVAANSDPKMYGGPFVALSEADVPATRELISRTESQCAPLIEFAQEWKAFDARLQSSATGASLNELYDSLPGPLRGLVEFVYDVNDHARMRLFEDLYYAQADPAGTQEIGLRLCDAATRPFFMSTPRLDRRDTLFAPMPFRDSRIDRIAAARSSPVQLGELCEMLGTRIQDVDPDLFSLVPPVAPAAGCADDMVRMRYFGHACVLFETSDVAVMFDPFVACAAPEAGALSFRDIPQRIDYVVITHGHQDHFCAEMLLQLRERIGTVVVPANHQGCIADPSLRLMLRSLGISSVEVLEPFEEVALPGGRILSLPFTGEHADLDIYSKQTVALSLGGRQFLMLVDSDGRDADLYRRIGQWIGPVDAVFVGMECHGAPLTWLYEPLLSKAPTRRNSESRRLSGADCARAWQTLAQLQTERVFIYAMGQEPWMRYIMGLQYAPGAIQITESDRLTELCRQHGMECERLFGSRELRLARHR